MHALNVVSCWCGRSNIAVDASGAPLPDVLPVDDEGADADHAACLADLAASGAELAICACGRLESADLLAAVVAAASPRAA